MTSNVESNNKKYQIDFTKSQLDPIFTPDYKKHFEKIEITRLVEIEEMLCGSYEILEQLGFTFEGIKDCECIVKLDLWDFEDYLISSLNCYVESNDYGNLSELLHPANFVKNYDVNQNHSKKDRQGIAEKVYSYFHSIGLNFLFYNYIVKTISKSRYETLAAPQYLASLWATITFLQIALATDDSDIDEASRSYSLALAYSDSWQHIINGIEIFNQHDNSNEITTAEYLSQIGTKGARKRHEKTSMVRQYTINLMNQRKQENIFKNPNFDAGIISSDVYEFSKKIGANLTETNIKETIRKWMYQDNK